ncbi:Copper chaperone for superoxide dismutase [Nymphon striatum]|nr:Copper chaperone for superoxide dismutase [Nymphon striatum]KAG1656141.1 Copper chaperone for superoxide dismutase [Nymphon striatum]
MCIEFAVQMTCDACVKTVKSALEELDGTKLLQINLKTQQVLVETKHPSQVVLKQIESSGLKAVLKGYESYSGHEGAAVSEVSGISKGVARFLQIDHSKCLIDGNFDGLVPKHRYSFNVHEYGDFSVEDFRSIGDVYHNNDNSQKIDGHVTKEVADESGNVTFRVENDRMKVWDIIGRSFAVSDENNKIISGAIIARSAGLFQNPKKICQCDGVTIWEEREKRN